MCFDCQLDKSHALLFSKSTYVSQASLDLIFMDVWGPASVASTTGAWYYVNFLDNFSKFLWFFPIKLKSNVEAIFLQFQYYMEKYFECKVKTIQSDWGGEYRRLHNYFQKNGITHHIDCPHTHQQMGSIERRHRQIMEIGLSMVSHSNLPLKYWEDAFYTSTYIITHFPTSTLRNLSPYQMVYK